MTKLHQYDLPSEYLWRKKHTHVHIHMRVHNCFKLLEPYILVCSLSTCALKHIKVLLQFTLLFVMPVVSLLSLTAFHLLIMNTVVNSWVTIHPSSLIFLVSLVSPNLNFLFSYLTLFISLFVSLIKGTSSSDLSLREPGMYSLHRKICLQSSCVIPV